MYSIMKYELYLCVKIKILNYSLDDVTEKFAFRVYLSLRMYWSPFKFKLDLFPYTDSL